MMKKTDGFTLVELVVGILCAAVVTGAAISVMLMNARINRTVIDANVDLQNARIVTTLVEQMASEGSISRLEVIGDLPEHVDTGEREWYILDDSDSVILSYSPVNQTIYGRQNSVLMEKVSASTLTLSRSPLGGCLLGFSILVDDELFETSVFSRASNIRTTGMVLDENDLSITVQENESEMPDDSSNVELAPQTQVSSEGRLAFLSVLASQVGSGGYINNDPERDPYSLWYCKTKWGVNKYPTDWNATTPWCGCFISWAVNNVSGYSPETALLFADVEVGRNTFALANRKTKEYIATPGDLIFFSWDNDPDTLEHVGAVLYVDSSRGYIYTIEGNSSNQVALRRYPIKDPDIVGYGVLNWNSTTP